MKRLPYFRFTRISDDIEFIRPFSREFVYLEDYEVRGGRDPGPLPVRQSETELALQ